MRSKRFITFKISMITALFSAMLILQGCKPAQSDVIQETVVPVRVMEVPVAEKGNEYRFVAQVNATEHAKLAFQISGKIDAVNVKMGQTVKAGDVLATMDKENYQLAVTSNQAEFELQQAKLARSEQLIANRLISQAQYDQTYAAYKAAKTSLEQAKTDLSHTKLQAPFDGIVSLTHAKPHQFAGANQPVLNLLSNQQFDVQFNIPVPIAEQLKAQRLNENMLSVKLDNFPDLTLPARFKEIATQPDTDTNSYSVTLTVNRPATLNILPGMSGVAHIKQGSAAPAAILLPEGAFITKPSATDDINELTMPAQVWRIQPDTNQLEAITVELDAQGYVIGGVKAGDRIVTAGAKMLQHNQQIRGWEKEGGI